MEFFFLSSHHIGYKSKLCTVAPKKKRGREKTASNRLAIFVVTIQFSDQEDALDKSPKELKFNFSIKIRFPYDVHLFVGGQSSVWCN